MGRSIHSFGLFLRPNTKTSVKCFTSFFSLVSPWPPVERTRTRWASTPGCASTPWRLLASVPLGPPWASHSLHQKMFSHTSWHCCLGTVLHSVFGTARHCWDGTVTHFSLGTCLHSCFWRSLQTCLGTSLQSCFGTWRHCWTGTGRHFCLGTRLHLFLVTLRHWVSGTVWHSLLGTATHLGTATFLHVCLGSCFLNLLQRFLGTSLHVGSLCWEEEHCWLTALQVLLGTDRQFLPVAVPVSTLTPPPRLADSPGLLLFPRPIPAPMLAEMPGLLLPRPIPAPRLAESPGLPLLVSPIPPPMLPFNPKAPKVLPWLAWVGGSWVSHTVWKVVVQSWVTQDLVLVVVHSLSTTVWHFSSVTVSYSVVHFCSLTLEHCLSFTVVHSSSLTVVHCRFWLVWHLSSLTVWHCCLVVS